MELAFGTKQLRTVCEEDTAAEVAYGLSVSGQLRRRLADLRAARSLVELVVGRPTVDPTDEHVLIVDLCDGFVLRLRVNHLDPPRDQVAAIEWGRVRRLQVVSIGPRS